MLISRWLAGLWLAGAWLACADSFMFVHTTNAGGWATDLRAKVAATGLISAGDISLFNSNAATPTLAQLQANRAVMVCGNETPANASLLGDTLADYVDRGGFDSGGQLGQRS